MFKQRLLVRDLPVRRDHNPVIDLHVTSPYIIINDHYSLSY